MANTRHTRHNSPRGINLRNFRMNLGSLDSSKRDESNGPYFDDVTRKVGGLRVPNVCHIGGGYFWTEMIDFFIALSEFDCRIRPRSTIEPSPKGIRRLGWALRNCWVVYYQKTITSLVCLGSLDSSWLERVSRGVLDCIWVKVFWNFRKVLERYQK